MKFQTRFTYALVLLVTMMLSFVPTPACAGGSDELTNHWTSKVTTNRVYGANHDQLCLQSLDPAFQYLPRNCQQVDESCSSDSDCCQPGVGWVTIPSQATGQTNSCGDKYYTGPSYCSGSFLRNHFHSGEEVKCTGLPTGTCQVACKSANVCNVEGREMTIRGRKYKTVQRNPNPCCRLGTSCKAIPALRRPTSGEYANGVVGFVPFTNATTVVVDAVCDPCGGSDYAWAHCPAGECKKPTSVSNDEDDYYPYGKLGYFSLGAEYRLQGGGGYCIYAPMKGSRSASGASTIAAKSIGGGIYILGECCDEGSGGNTGPVLEEMTGSAAAAVSVVKPGTSQIVPFGSVSGARLYKVVGCGGKPAGS